MRLDVYVHLMVADSRPSGVQETLDTILNHLLRQETLMTQQLDRIRQEVAENTDATRSAAALIRGLSGQIRELKDDPAALEALAADLDAATATLVAAIAENTPAATPVETGGDTEGSTAAAEAELAAG